MTSKNCVNHRRTRPHVLCFAWADSHKCHASSVFFFVVIRFTGSITGNVLYYTQSALNLQIYVVLFVFAALPRAYETFVSNFAIGYLSDLVGNWLRGFWLTSAAENCLIFQFLVGLSVGGDEGTRMNCTRSLGHSSDLQKLCEEKILYSTYKIWSYILLGNRQLVNNVTKITGV